MDARHRTDSPSAAQKGLTGFALAHGHLIVVGSLMVAILGVLALVTLPKDLLPSANQPAVQILSFYSGMPVNDVANNLTARFERYTGQAIGIQRQESKSLVGVSIVRNFFNSNVDLNSAISQTTSLVLSVLRKLPPGTQPPLILPFDPMASVPLALIAVSGREPQKELYDVARYDVRDAIQAVRGAMAPTVMGGAEREAVIYLNPQKLRRYNFSPLDVINKLNQLNTFVPTGDIKIGKLDYQIVSNGLPEKINEMNKFPLRARQGVVVDLSQIGRAEDSHQIQTNVVRIDGKPQVYVPIYRQPGANSLQVINNIRVSVQKLNTRLKNVTLRVVADQSQFIRHAIHSISEEAMIGGGLAALLVLLFLGNPTATGGVLLSIPMSLLFAFIGLKIAHQTINAMTLGGLALSIGVLVDNSIVVLENIMRRLSEGLSPLEAAREGGAEVAMPVLASTLATLVVFFPVVFLHGIVRILFSALACAVMFAMVGSYFSAVMVIPLFSSKFVKQGMGSQTRGVLGRIGRWIDRFTLGYGNLLAKALKHAKVLLVVIVLGLLATLPLVTRIGTELFPRADSGNFVLDLRLASGTRIEQTEKFAKQIEAKLHRWIKPSDLSMVITNAGVYYGFPAAFTPNSGTQDVFFDVELTRDREHTSQWYAKLVRQKMREQYPNVDVGVELGGLMTSALNGGLRSPIDIQLQGPDMVKARQIAARLLPKFKKIRGAVDVRIQQRLDAPIIKLDVDRNKAAKVGLTTDEVVKNIVAAVSGSSTFNSAIWVDPKTGIDYLLGVQFHQKKLASFKEFENIPITGRGQDRAVPLSSIAKITLTQGLSEVEHVNLMPVIDVFMDAQGRDIGGVSRDAQSLIAKSHIPKGYDVTVRGEYSQMRRAVRSLGGGFLLAAILVYLILVAQFRSFLLPAIIMATVPMGMAGIVVMLFLTHTYFSIQAAIGAIFMIGIAVANGVLLIEFILHHSREGADLDEAIIRASKIRLRPILMTSLASILGLIPMAVGIGHGSEANIPLGRAVIGGELLSTALTLFVVPMLFRLLIGPKKPDAVAQKSDLLPNLMGGWKESGQSVRTMSIMFICSLFLFSATPARAGTLTLNEVLKLAEKASPEMLSSAQRLLARQQEVTIAKSNYFPSAHLDMVDSTGFPGSMGLLGMSGVAGSPYRSGWGVAATVKQDVWDFGRTSWEVKRARYGAKAQAFQSAVVKSHLDMMAAQAYFSCVRYRDQVDNWRFVRRQAELVAREVKKFVATGQRSIVERYLVEAQVDQATTFIEDYKERMTSDLKRIGVLTGLNWLQIGCPRSAGMGNPRILARLARATKNPRIFAAEAKAKIFHAQVRRTLAERYPKIFALASVGDPQSVRLVNPDDDHYAVGLGITMPLFEGFRIDADIRRSRALSTASDFDAEAARQNVDLTNAKYDEIIQGALTRLKYLNKELELGKVGFALAKKRYLSLQGDLVDVREALRNFSRVRADRTDTNSVYLAAVYSKALFNGWRPRQM